MKTVAVTGAGGGLGWAICDTLRDAGWDVERLMRANGWDVTSSKLNEWLRQPMLNPIHALVCCHAAPIGATFEQTITVDLIGAHNACMAVMPGMVLRRWGRIILLSSIRARQPRAGQVAYAAAKAGVEGLARALAVEYGGYGITVNVVAPGAVTTPRTTANIAAGIVSEKELVGRTPAGRLAAPADVAAAVLWLLSDGAAMINGATLMLDGGWSVHG